MKKVLNKWQIVLHFKRSMEVMPYKVIFRFGIFNIHTFPEMGESFWEKHYKGFIWELRFWHPLSKLRMFLEKLGY